ncbi:MAG: tetratricopeptide repeat protein [Candidatus Aminicenantes bacterium]|nr:tetratricopeptide repeat protein [Candidatus Aminicenantes bacterium]
MKKQIILFVAALIGCSVWLYPQLGMGTGRIQGTVYDEKGQALHGAKVKVQNVMYKNALAATSDKRGHWSLVGLSSGSYTVQVTLEGYENRTDQIEYREVTKREFFWDVKLSTKGTVPAAAPAAPEAKNGESEALAALLQADAQLYAEKQYAKAVEAYLELLENNPRIYPVYVNIANSYREMQDFEKAVASYQTYLDKVVADKGSLSAEPVTATVLLSMGEISLDQGNPEKAKGYFKLAVDNFPTSEILAYNIGEIFFKKGQMEQAIEYLKLATRLKDSWAPPYLRLGYAYLNRGQYDAALSSLKKFLELAPDDLQAPTIKNLLPDIEKLAKKNPG